MTNCQPCNDGTHDDRECTYTCNCTHWGHEDLDSTGYTIGSEVKNK